MILMRDDDFSDRLHRSANFSGFTPLHYAALGDSLECVQLLVNAGNFFELFLIKITFINAQDQSILAFDPWCCMVWYFSLQYHPLIT